MVQLQTKMNSPDNIHYFTNIRWKQQEHKYQTLMEHIREGILNQTLKDWLPSSRQLAALCSLNRNTVVKALEELAWEGWLISFPQKGLKVNTAMAKTRQSRQVAYNIPYKLKQASLHNFPVTGTSMHEPAYQQAKTRFLQQHDGTTPHQLLQEWIYHKWGFHIGVSHIGFAGSIFECNYILSRLLLESADSIIGSPKARQALASHLPNLDITLLSLPVCNSRLQLEQLKQILETHNNIKFLYLHNTLDELALDPAGIINLMELCFRHGVLIIENIVIHADNLLHKMNLCKFYDYKHYVITCIHNQLIAGEQFSYILAHPSILEQVSRMEENMHAHTHLPSLAYHLQFLLQPKQLNKMKSG